MKQDYRSFAVVRCGLALLALALPMAATAQVVYTYDAVPGTPAINDNACTSVTINVPDSFNVGNDQVAIGVDVTHTYRGDLSLWVDPPEAGEANKIFLDRTAADGNDNFRILVSTNNDTTSASNDADADTAAQTIRYRRLVRYTNTGGQRGPFDDVATTHPVNGNWVVSVCDGAANDTGTLNSVRLVLRDETGTAPASCGTKTTYDWGANGNNNAFTSTTIRGITLSEVSNSGNPPGDTEPSFRTSTGQRGADTGYYSYRIDATGDSELTLEWTLFNFDVPVHGLSFSTLDGDYSGNYEDYVRVDGFADAAMTIPVPKLNTMGSLLQRAGDINEADTGGANDNQTIGNSLWSFTGPVRRVRVIYAQGDELMTDSTTQYVGIGDFSYCGFDFGDALDSYDTNFADGGARHTMGARTVYMGTQPDGEADGVGGAAANSDGADETGSLTLATFVATPRPHFECAWSGGTYSTAEGEYCVTVNVTNTSGSGAQLVGWLDMNDDGDFLDANERSLPRLGGFTSGNSGDATFTTANIPTGTSNLTRVLVWSGRPGANLASATYLRLRLTTDASFMSDSSPQPTGLAADGEVEDHRIAADTLPVTVASVQSQVVGNALELRFTTASETDHVGFTIEERGDTGMRVLRDLIASGNSVSTETRAYSVRLPSVPASGAFYIVDHDIHGRRTAHGPFAVGARIGQDLSNDRFDWTATANAVAQARGNVAGADAARLWVTEPGFHRVTAAQLASAGVDLSGVAVDQIAVTFRGRGVPRRIEPATGAFGPGSFIDFPVSESFSLYTREFPYLIKADGVGVVGISRNERVADVEEAAWYWAESTYAPDVVYNHSSPSADPWFAASLLGRPGLPASHQHDLAVTALAAGGEFAELTADLAGVTDWAGGEADHHVQLQINNQVVVDERFDGAIATTLRARLPLLSDGNLDVSVVVPGDTGYDFDMNNVEAYRLRYPRMPRAEDGRLWIDALQSSAQFFNEGAGDGFEDAHLVSGFEAPDHVPGFRVDGLNDGEVVAYVGRGDEWAWLAQSASAGGGAAMVASDTGSSYWVSNVSALRSVRVEAMPASEPLIGGAVDYLIISPTVFLGELQPLVSLQHSRGLTTRVVDLQQIYDQYNHSVPEAAAIQRYLDAAAPAMGVDYVLLVGGDTYDYKNFLGTGSISLVPTQYAKVGDIITFAPVDALYADANRDGAPEFALGRLPVRSIAELQALLPKLSAVSGTVGARKLMLVAQTADEDGDYASISDAFAGQLPDTWTTTRAYADDLGASGARSSLLAALNSNYNLLNYVGHSASVQWSFDPILTSADIANATGAPVDLVVQWGCWNSYFVSPSANTLAHKFLNTPGHGAAGVIGVTSLTELKSHEALGQLLYPELASGSRVGDALRFAKMQLAAQGSLYSDILMTATLLGDPAMPVR